jgi:phosphoenolpyruvate carboxykinase (GTP)
MTRPRRIVWCDGSEGERERLLDEMLQDRELLPLDPASCPGSYLHRSDPSDVARSEHLTFICSGDEADAGPLNNWMPPAEARKKVGAILEGSMEGRTLYVVPYLLGPASSPAAKVGVQVTDSRYVVLSLGIMTRMGAPALERLGNSADFVPGLHSLGDLDPERRFICHFPEDRSIWSVGSGYGGNALLSKKCFALRIASVQARDEGWLAEHMLIVGIEDPRGRVTYVAAAFPSACGKTNLATLAPPAALEGYRVWTVGDDIAWFRINDGEGLSAINPEAGFFGVAPGTSRERSPNILAAIRRNTIFTNVALTRTGEPWWEGLGEPPTGLLDWQGHKWSPGAGEPAAHPNARFTTPASQCPTISPRWEDPAGVPISAIIFGGRRARLMPLVLETFGWEHGVYTGAVMASETTAAASGKVGVVRRDPMAMRPFCGYNAGDYLGHWLAMGKRLRNPPRIFHVNWFLRGADGQFLWPGYGENLRVLRWIAERSSGEAQATETPMGFIPAPGALDLEGLRLPAGSPDALFPVSRAEWENEHRERAAFLKSLGPRVPRAILDEHAAQGERLGL